MLSKVLYRLYRRIKPLLENAWFTSEYVDLFNAEANRYIRTTLKNSVGGNADKTRIL